jgi:nicotinate phosphoribosyltransferase
MIINSFLDNDLYKFTTMNAVQKLYPGVLARYAFINRGGTVFPAGFAEALRKEVDSMALLKLTADEEAFIRRKCYYFDKVFLDLLKGYRYDPSEVVIEQEKDTLKVEVTGYWYRTVLWEVPLLAIISELYFRIMDLHPSGAPQKASEKAKVLAEMDADYSDFGTRRRFSAEIHEKVLEVLLEKSEGHLLGTSNIHFARLFNITPIGTHPHEWFMFHGASFGYRHATAAALGAWVDVYQGSLGIALSDTFTSANFFSSFSTKFAKLFDGVRCDSGDPLYFTDYVIDFYRSKNINPQSKTIVFSDALDLEKIKRIKSHVAGRIRDVYGIGTYLTNDAGHEPLNMVIKMTEIDTGSGRFYPVVKLSDDPQKRSGDKDEIYLCRHMLDLS